MQRPLLLSPPANEDMLTTALYYEECRTGLGDEFLLALEAAFDRIVFAPEAYSTVEGDIRRALMRRFPFGIYYSIEPDHIVILAILHAGRDPSTWKSRPLAD